MHLFRIHAYEVTPQRLSNATTAPRGGAFSADAAFKKSLQAFLDNSQLTTQPTVDFRVPNRDANATTPAHVVRSHLLDYCFGAPATAKSSAIALATKLGESMDDRSPFDVIVSAPFGTVGNSVVIDEQNQQRRLHCEGDIVDEKVRARHA